MHAYFVVLYYVWRGTKVSFAVTVGSHY
jgi:hypothetical protein